MSCYHPLKAAMMGKKVYLDLDAASKGRPLLLPCGKCIGCLMDRARMWSIRIMHEAQLYSNNYFVTMTYEDEFLPKSRSLEIRDWQLFMKKLRKYFKGYEASPSGRFPIRFFCAGEYGATYQRPHWHVILFNLHLHDAVPLSEGTVRSKCLEKIWGNGNIVIGTVTPQSASYVSGYTLFKKGRSGLVDSVLDKDTGELTSRRREFVVMSRKPGIGYWWYQKYRGDLVNDQAVMPEGRVYKVPRFYLDKMEGDDLGSFEEIKYARYLSSLEHPEEGTEERLAIREEYATRKLVDNSKRSLE